MLKILPLVKPLFFLLYLSASLFGLYKLKVAELGFNLDFLLGVFAYGSSFFLWIVVLRWYPLSVVFPLAAGSLIVGTQLVGMHFLNEPLDRLSIFAIGLILAGLLTLAGIGYSRGQL